MKRLITVLAALAMMAGGEATAPAAADAAEAECCWLYCEAYRDTCYFLARDDRDLCDAWYEGCMKGCSYKAQPGGGGGGAF